MKILILRSNSFRHKYLSSLLKLEGLEVAEIIETVEKPKDLAHHLIYEHFKARNQIEQDFFLDLINSDKKVTKQIHTTNINSKANLVFANRIKPHILIAFGCGILGPDWLNQYQNQILGIHLGLSPYYRGSGSNFFPFVNNDLGAVGYTLMNIDQGIDTGGIIHQSYGVFIQGDGIHSVGTRLMRNMFHDIIKILQNEVQLTDSINLPADLSQKMYRRSDFTLKNLEIALNNIRSGSIDSFLNNLEDERNKFPLVRNLSI
jgi:phosphoribosylglycinamide formyltransferase-1